MGTVDLADVGKVVFEGPVVQVLGVSGVTARSEVVRPQVTATIRYGVTPEGFGAFTNIQQLELWACFRDGQGRFIATLVEVNANTGVETPLPLSVDSNDFPPPQTSFKSRNQQAKQGHPLDFVHSAYYVKVTLSRPEIPRMVTPPAVATLQLMRKGQD